MVNCGRGIIPVATSQYDMWIGSENVRTDYTGGLLSHSATSSCPTPRLRHLLLRQDVLEVWCRTSVWLVRDKDALRLLGRNDTGGGMRSWNGRHRSMWLW